MLPSFYRGENRLIEAKPCAQEHSKRREGIPTALSQPHLALQHYFWYTCAYWNWFAVSAEPMGKSRDLKFLLVVTEGRNLQKETTEYTQCLSPFSSQCKPHSRLALQITRGAEEHLSTVEGPCIHLGY